MNDKKLIKVYDDHRLKDITDSLIAIKKSEKNNIPDKLLSLLRLDKESKLKKSINSVLGRLHSCEVSGGDLSNTITEQTGNPSFNNILVGLDEEFNPTYLNGLDKHLMITGGSGFGKSSFVLNLMHQVLGKNGGATVIDGRGCSTDLNEFLSLAKQYNLLDDVLVLDFSENYNMITDPNTGRIERDPTPVKSKTFNIFKDIGVQDALLLLKQVVSGDSTSGESGNDFFKNQQFNYFDNCGLILKYLDQKGEDVNLGIFNEITDLKAHIIQAIPASNPEAPVDQQVPDEKLVSLNMLNGYEKFWIPKTYGAADEESYVKQILALLDSYGYYTETNPDVEYDPLGDNLQISDQLQKQIGGFATGGLSKLKTLSDKYGHIFNASTSDISFRDAILQGKIIYVRIGLGNHNSSNLISLLINSIVDAVCRPLGKMDIENHRDRAKKFPAHLLVLDGIVPFIKDSIGAFEQLLSTARSMNVSIILSSQNNAFNAEDKDTFKEKLTSNTYTHINFPKMT